MTWTRKAMLLVVKNPSDDALTIYLNGHRIAGPSAYGRKLPVVLTAPVEPRDLEIAESSVFGWDDFIAS